MGRRAKGHCYVKYILLLNRNGEIGQRHELDSHGKLIHPVEPFSKLNFIPDVPPPPVAPPIPIEMKKPINIPMPPMLRSKFQISSFFNPALNLDSDGHPAISVPSIENVIDVRVKQIPTITLS